MHCFLADLEEVPHRWILWLLIQDVVAEATELRLALLLIHKCCEGLLLGPTKIHR